LPAEAYRAEFATWFPNTGTRLMALPVPSLVQMADDLVTAGRRARSSLGIGRHTFLFTFFGYLYRGKGIELLLRAFARLIRHHHEDVALAIVGGTIPGREPRAYVKRVRRLAHRLRIADHIR